MKDLLIWLFVIIIILILCYIFILKDSDKNLEANIPNSLDTLKLSSVVRRQAKTTEDFIDSEDYRSKRNTIIPIHDEIKRNILTVNIKIPPEYDPMTSVISQITPNVFISDFYASFDYQTLITRGIKQILTVGYDMDIYRPKDFSVMNITAYDASNENLYKHFDSAYKFIEQAPTLIHCYKGISRSATILIAYLMKKNKWNLNKAINYVRRIRPFVNPNPGFYQQLERYEQDLRKSKDLSF